MKTQAPADRFFAHFLILFISFGFLFGASAQKTNMPKAASTSTDTNAIKAELETAVHQVEKIVNQPVAAYRKAPGMHVSVFNEGWFHPGANKPVFDNLDVRIYQQTPYAQYQYVTSPLNPGIVFRGADLEFNAMIKYFYTNRTLPKKKLTGPEMEEINRLYRIIGRCEHQLVPPPVPYVPETASDATDAGTPAGTGSKARSVFLNPWIGGGLIAGLILVVLFSRLSRA